LTVVAEVDLGSKYSLLQRRWAVSRPGGFLSAPPNPWPGRRTPREAGGKIRDAFGERHYPLIDLKLLEQEREGFSAAAMQRNAAEKVRVDRGPFGDGCLAGSGKWSDASPTDRWLGWRTLSRR